MKERVVFCWSGGKDSALALHRLLRDGRYEVVALVTTCNEHFQRVSMHGVRLALLEAQATALQLPLQKVFVSERSSNDEYSERMAACLRSFRDRGISTCVFGDIFLEDLRRWREQQLAQIGMRGLFPIWKEPSADLIDEFLKYRFRSVTCCVDDAWFDDTAVGRVLDESFIRSLPAAVDVCGENGEFHTFAFDGPIFHVPVRFQIGEKIYRPLEHASHQTAADTSSGRRRTRGFWFCDLLPA